MATPIDQIGLPELVPTLKIFAKAGGTTDHSDWMRGGKDEVNARKLVAFINEQMAAEVVQKRASEVVIKESGYAGPYACERARGPYWTYPTGWQPKSAVERAKILMPHFPGLDFSHVEALVERYYVNVVAAGETNYREAPRAERKLVLPETADGGLIVFPKLEAVLKCMRKPNKGWQPLNIAMKYLLGVIKEAFPAFSDYTNGMVGPEYEQLLKVTARMLAKLGAKTPGDVLVLPFQAGALFAGYSVRSSRGHMEALKRHIPAHDFANGCLALTDPERFAQGALVADCGGTERAPRAGGDFCRAPYWCFDDGELEFHSRDVGHDNSNYGSTSFVLPE